MAANYDLIVIHGPPSPAIPGILKQRLSNFEGYVHVYPAQLYKDHPGFGVRDIASYVLGLLKEHRRVVVEDSCSEGGVRNCLLKVIPSKLSACRVGIIEVRPRHGQQQTLWERQFILAASPYPHLVLSDEQIRHWFDEHGLFKISASLPSDAGLKETVSVHLTAATNYKFEVPSLLIQWECVVDSGGYLQGRMTVVCQDWAQVNPHGRVIVLCDGTAVAKGHLSAAQQKSQIINGMKALANELPCPVYVLQVTSTLDAGDFSLPPSPGLLAFLQRRHCIDLHHRNTVYVYSDSRHMKMAERAGVRHIKIGQVLKNPAVVKKGYRRMN
ncbi:uncharacterized protein LOC143296157 [Babylonia areolata]|uniref:uncharacterized protein LOC143296157 n=1 Tax=Babylonia areolata TaxID=304850 RepID=UPI003FD3E491